MALNLDQWYLFHFAGLGDYWIKVVLERDDSISWNAFVFESETINSGQHFLSAILEPQRDGFYGLTDQGRYCYKSGTIVEEGIASVAHEEFYTLAWSEEILIEASNAWVMKSGHAFVFHILFKLSDDEIAPCTPGGVWPDALEGSGTLGLENPAVFACPSDGDTDGSPRKKKVRVIWKKDYLVKKSAPQDSTE